MFRVSVLAIVLVSGVVVGYFGVFVVVGVVVVVGREVFKRIGVRRLVEKSVAEECAERMFEEGFGKALADKLAFSAVDEGGEEVRCFLEVVDSLDRISRSRGIEEALSSVLERSGLFRVRCYVRVLRDSSLIGVPWENGGYLPDLGSIVLDLAL